MTIILRPNLIIGRNREPVSYTVCVAIAIDTLTTRRKCFRNPHRLFFSLRLPGAELRYTFSTFGMPVLHTRICSASRQIKFAIGDEFNQYIHYSIILFRVTLTGMNGYKHKTILITLLRVVLDVNVSLCLRMCSLRLLFCHFAA